MREPTIYAVRISEISLGEPDPGTQAEAPFLKQNIVESENQNDRAFWGLPLPRKAWLFQSNPVLYDLRGALGSLCEQVWSVSRYAKEIRTGDRVYLWEAGRAGGLAGVAEIAESVRLRAERPEQHPFARVVDAFAGERPRVRLRIRYVIEPVIPRQSILSLPGLSDLGVLRCSRGTNFRLNLVQWQALNDVVVSGGV